MPFKSSKKTKNQTKRFEWWGLLFGNQAIESAELLFDSSEIPSKEVSSKEVSSKELPSKEVPSRDNGTSVSEADRESANGQSDSAR